MGVSRTSAAMCALMSVADVMVRVSLSVCVSGVGGVVGPDASYALVDERDVLGVLFAPYGTEP